MEFLEKSGRGIAVADLNGNGKFDIVIFQIDNPDGTNRGLYRVGRDIDENGSVNGGWSPWREIPDWGSSDNQGGGITLADINGDGKVELIVLQIDNSQNNVRSGLNKGLYKIGFEIDNDGNINGNWGPWMSIPGWLSWENQGGGIAVADLDGDTKPEIIIFQIDNPPELNKGQYQIGWNVNATGIVTEWSPWVTFPNWESWEDSGGGIALAHFPGAVRPELIAFHIDNRPQENAGLYQVFDLQVDLDEKEIKGVWRLLPYDSQILPVHAALLHTGKVLFYSGSGNNTVRFSSNLFGNVGQGIFCSVVWDYENGNTFIHPPTITESQGGRPVDFFCGGEAFLPDGRLLVAGGTKEYDVNHPFFGRKDALVFDPITEKWSLAANMANGRWYPTLIELGDGSILASSGLDENGQPNKSLEKYTDIAGWTFQRNAEVPLYPHLFLLQNGDIFHSGGQMDTDEDAKALLFSLKNNSLETITGLKDIQRRNQSASVLLPPAQEQKVIIIGGGPENDKDPNVRATNSVQIIDLKNHNPQYRDVNSLHQERMHLNAIILPDRTILVCGGSGRKEKVLDATLEAEIFNPTDESWSVMAAATIPRMYHSVGLLLPDGRVFAASSNPDRGQQVGWEPADPFEELRIEIYSPPYVFKERPIINNAPQQCTYGRNFQILTNKANAIKWVHLIKPGVTTHSFNNEQRLVDLKFTVEADGTKINAQTISEANIAPPGWYMLFITDINDVPSVAHWIQLHQSDQ